MSKYLKSAQGVSVLSDHEVTVSSILPPATYTPVIPDMGAPYFKVVDNFVVPPRVYGDVEQQTKRIVNTFADRVTNTGVLLHGVPGSGKSLLARSISKVLQEMDRDLNASFNLLNQLPEAIGEVKPVDR